MQSVKINVNMPESWMELTDSQLYYVYALLADNLSSTQVKTYCFFHFTGIKILHRYGDGWEISQGRVRGYVSAALIAAAIHSLDWIDDLPDMPVRISKIKGAQAAYATLQEFSFGKFLYCDNLYQGFLETQNHRLLVEMAKLLYDTEEIQLTQAEKISIFYWWVAVKSLFSKTFVHFLTPASTDEVVMGGIPLQQKLQRAMNAQIRCLTGGDVTKYNQVLDLDVWTAMWELDAKAEEYAEMQRKYGK